MYIYIVTRTQIYLTAEMERALDRLAKSRGVTKSQLIRDAVERVYLRPRNRAEQLRALKESAGAWRRRESGADHVERMRRGRLATLHAADK